MKKVRWLSILLAFLMILEWIPLSVFASTAKNGIITAYWSDAISVDGNLTESVWLSSQTIGSEGEPSGQLAAAWDKTSLYLGLWYENATSLKVEKGSFSREITLTGTNKTAEVALSWSELGVTLFDYQQTIEGFRLTLGNATSSSELNASVQIGMNTQSALTAALTPKKDTVTKSSDGKTITWNAATGTSYAYHVAESAQYQTAIDHSKDLLIEQTLCITTLPHGASAKLSKSNECANSVYFSFTDVDDRSGANAGSGLSAAVYNHYPETDGSLWLRVHNDEYNSNGCCDVSLGKKLGDTFRLSFLWKTDNSVTVYVDGQQIATAQNATIGKTSGLGTKCARITYYGKDAADFTVSDLHVSTASDDSVISDIRDSVLSDVSLDAVETSLTLPAVYEDSILGNIPLTWSSSNESVLKPDGTVIRPTGGSSATVTLTLSVGDTKVKDFSVTVLPASVTEEAAIHAVWSDSVTLDGQLTEKEWVSTQSIGAEAGPRGEVAAVWNKNALYLGIRYESATNLSVSCGSYTQTVDLTNDTTTENAVNCSSASTVEVRIPWTELGGAPTDYYQTLHGLTVKLSNSSAESTLCTGVTNTTLTGRDISLNEFTKKADGVSVSDGTATWDATSRAELVKTDISFVDHSKDILLTQELSIESLENGYGTLAPSNFSVDKCYYFIISDRTLEGSNEVASAALFCSVFWSQSDSTLYFRVSGNTTDGKRLNYSAPLNRQFSETFTLSVLWGADDSVDVFLDGKPILSKENITLSDMKGLGTETISFNNSGAAKLTLSPLSICTSENATIKDVLLSANLLSESALKALASDLTLPTVYHDNMLGDIPLTWRSSNTGVLGNDGRVTPPTTGTANATLTLSVNGEDIKTWDVTVCRAAVKANCADTINVDGNLSELYWYLAYPMSGDLSGSMYAVYNRNGLYLGLKYSGATTATVSLNSKTATVALSDGTVTGLDGAAAASRPGTTEIFLPWTALGITLEDYNQIFSDFSISISDDDNHSSTLAGSLRITSEQVKSVSVVPEVSAGITYENGIGTWDTNSTSAVSLCGKNSIIDHSKDILFNQDLCFTAMPKGDGFVTNKLATRNCYHFWVCDKDDKAKDDDGKYINNAGTSLFCTIYDPKANDGFLRLRVIKNLNDNAYAADVSLGKKLGEKFTLSVLWGADDSVVVYVDNQIVGEAEDATSVATRGMGDKYVYLRYTAVSGSENAKFTVSNVNMVITAAESVLDEITEAMLLPNVDLTHIKNDIMLSSSYESAYIGAVPITWASSAPAVLSASGEVGEVTQATDVTLTATVRGKTILTKTVTVIPSSGTEDETAMQSPANITTAFSASAISVDGKIEEEGWILSTGILDSDSKLKGKFGVQWQKDKLYFAANIRNVTTLKLSFGDKTAEITLSDLSHTGSLISAIQKSLNYVELAIPFTALDVTPQYGTVLPICVEMDGNTFTGNLILSSVDWFAADNEYRPLRVYAESTRLGDGYPVAGYQDYEQVADGWRMYDLYNPDGSNPARARTEIAYWKDSVYSGLGDRSSNIYAEFDFYAKQMPVYDVNSDIGWHDGFASYGMTWWIAENEDGGGSVNSVSFGIMNTGDGLIFAALRDGTTPYMKLLDKQVGDLFRVGTLWKVNGDVDLYIDGVKVATIEGVESRRKGYGDKVISFNLIRNATYATSYADNLDVTITNLGLGHTFSPVDEVTFDTIRAENIEQDSITSNLYLPTTWMDTQLNVATTITWTSSNPDVVDASTGTVTRPQNGAKQVRLTAAFSDGTSKTFDLLVLGISTQSGNVLVVNKDYDPGNTAGAVTDKVMFTLDTDNNSVICDLGESKTVNVVELKDGDSFSRLNEEVLQLWVSNDNKTYTRVKDFKLLHKENVWYLYDFSATGRYVKVHCTHFNGDEADFTGVTADMITAYQQDVFGYAGSDYSTRTYTVSNTGNENRYDYAWHISKTELALSGSDESIRVFLGNELLYHYTTSTELIVRIPQLNAGASASLRILYGNQDAMDIANQEYVYEVTYGTREARNVLPNVRWVYKFEDSGKIIGMSDNGTSQGLNCAFSTDDGRTWTDRKKIDCTVGKFTGTCGFIYDSHTKRLMVSGYLETDSTHSTIGLIYTDDEGETWSYIGTVETDGQYLCSYTDGIELSCYDGTGPNVDFVFTACYKNVTNNTYTCQPIYSCDAGLTWQSSEPIYYQENASHEGGMSEGTLMERDDGVIVLICRNQGFGLDNFAQSYSYDHGKTWVNPAKLSSIYTVNTQPILFRYGDEVLLSWGGNNMMGGESRLRTPHSVGVTYDGMETFRNIQDLYVKYSFQGLTNASMNRITNQKVVITDQDTFLSCWMNLAKAQSEWTNMLIRVEDFHDFFYRTKNAYDSFEHGTVKYEGWDCTRGTATITNAQATNGTYSMKLDDAVVARSIPSLQDGTVSMDIYVEDTANFTLELQSAYTNVYGKGAPVGLSVSSNAVTLTGSETSIGNLHTGWNTLVFELDLDADVPSATFVLNDGNAVSVPVHTDIGNYVCFITIMNSGSLMVDNVLVESDLDALNVKAEYEANEPIAESVREMIDAIGTVTLDSADAIEAARNAYDALTEDQKALVFNYAALEEAEDLYAELAGDQNPTPTPPVTPVTPSVSPITKPTDTNKDLPFTDVSRSDWFYSEVKEAYEAGIMNGTSSTRFEPNTAITRAMVVTILYRLENEPAVNSTCRFIDVASGSYYEKAVIWASENGIVTGYNETTFGPADSITREQLAAILYRYAKYKGCDMSAQTNLNRYTDAAAVSTYATTPMEWAVASGLISGTGASNLSPKSTATRAQVAVIIIRFLDLNAN